MEERILNNKITMLEAMVAELEGETARLREILESNCQENAKFRAHLGRVEAEAEMAEIRAGETMRQLKKQHEAELTARDILIAELEEKALMVDKLQDIIYAHHKTDLEAKKSGPEEEYLVEGDWVVTDESSE